MNNGEVSLQLWKTRTQENPAPEDFSWVITFNPVFMHEGTFKLVLTEEQMQEVYFRFMDKPEKQAEKDYDDELDKILEE